MDRTIYVAKTKALISFAVNCEADLRLCFRIYAKCLFSHDVANITLCPHIRLCCLHSLYFISFIGCHSERNKRQSETDEDHLAAETVFSIVVLNSLELFLIRI